MSKSDPSLSILRQKVLKLPGAIPSEARFPFNSGHRSFFYRQLGEQKDLFMHQKVKVSGHVLVYVDQGYLHMEEGTVPHIMEAGQAAVFSDTEICISQMAGPNGVGDFFWMFFNDRVLAHSIPTCLEMFRRFHMFANFPGRDGVVFFKRCPLHLDILKAQGLPNILKPTLLLALNQLSGGFLRVCMRRVIIPRTRILLFLERLMLRPRKDHPGLLNDYPGGRTALRREMSQLAMPSVAKLVTERRQEILHTWLTEGALEDDILKAFQLGILGRLEPASTEALFTRPAAPVDPVDSPSEPIDFSDTRINELLEEIELDFVPGLEDWRRLLDAA